MNRKAAKRALIKTYLAHFPRTPDGRETVYRDARRGLRVKHRGGKCVVEVRGYSRTRVVWHRLAAAETWAGAINQSQHRWPA